MDNPHRPKDGETRCEVHRDLTPNSTWQCKWQAGHEGDHHFERIGLCPDVITRCTENTTSVNGLGESQGWRDTFYPLDTPEKVYEHLAYNCLVNGVTDITRLDGWADVPEDAVRMWVDRNSVESEDIWRSV